MPALNWVVFTSLPGSAEKNFELLCRGIVLKNFGSYGVFRALANQPGVEFHLKLDRRCDALGNPGRWWGWQCKWYDLPASSGLGSTRRAKIEEGIRKTEAQVPGVTDWVLWTRRPLTRGDQEWFNGISSKMTLHLWAADEVDNLLVGQAAVLRGTYFGELVLTPEILREMHEQAVAPIRARWQPEVHYVVDAERALRRMLGDSGSWDELRALAVDLRSMAQFVEAAPTVPTSLAPLVKTSVSTSRQFADVLERVALGIRDGDLDLLRDDLTSQPRVLTTDIATAPRRLRAGNQRAGLYVTNAVGGCREALRLLAAVEAAFSSGVVAVLAPAGSGKTHLAAQFTTSTDARPDGVLLHGRDLHANHTLDDLARRILIAAQPVQSIELLLAAVDAAGQRARHRLPVVIDGLNEAEDPRAWKRLLAALGSTLVKYPYVLLVCTLRPEFADETLPDGTLRVEIEGYGNETIDAIRAHFRHYKIEATDASLPIELLAHPLTLRLFCEVTNPTRQKVVGLDAMPGSLTALFDRYLHQAGDRVAELAHVTYRYLAQDVRAALTVIGNCLWDSRARYLDVDELRRALGDEGRVWNQSLVRALEQEGILLRMPSKGSGSYVPAYDRLGGHIIANALLAKHGQVGFETWIREPSTTTVLTSGKDRHPLADDIVHALAGQIPRRFHSKQLWQLADEPLRARALRSAARLEAAYLDVATVEALLDLVRHGEPRLLEQLWEVRGTISHPLNAEALDRVLRPMGVADRDLSWTEWLRGYQDEVLPDLEYLERHWRQGGLRVGDRLRARWVMWTLTSTNRRLRDQATLALYCFGRVDPQGLFELAIGSLSVNDPYVSERMLGASYGVVMSHQDADVSFANYLGPFLEQLAASLVGASATNPTFHYLARLYARGIVAFSAKFYPSSLPASLRDTWSFGVPAPVLPLVDADPAAEEVGQTLHMDFENYTIGRLFDDRRNYDMNHVGHQAAVAHVRGSVRALGWRTDAFAALDKTIAENDYHRSGQGDRPHTERYGKKYGRIGFFTYAGVLDDSGQLPSGSCPLSDVDIDPSFPVTPPADGDSSACETWLSPTEESHETWIRNGITVVPHSVLRREKVGDYGGPWVVVHGFLKAEDRILGREVWAFISALVTDKENAPRLEATLRSALHPQVGRDVPRDYYIFAGEIPWHPNFAVMAAQEDAYSENVHTDSGDVRVELLAHQYAWESYHSEMNGAGHTCVPSRSFSARFNLRGAPQVFDQFLPDGTRATITLRGVEGLHGDILYIREDLLRQYADDRSIVWFAFGQREIRPYPPSPAEWLIKAQREQSNAWHVVLTETDVELLIRKVAVAPRNKARGSSSKTTQKAGTKAVARKRRQP